MGIPGPGNGFPGKSGTPATPGATPNPATSGTGVATRDRFDWTYWWDLEKDQFLGSPDRLRRPPLVRSGDDVGRQLGKRPESGLVVASVLPVLLDALATERHVDIQTASLIALARIGKNLGEPRARALVGPILEHVPSSSQEVSETAILALGILGHETAIETLLGILGDTDEAGRLLKRDKIPSRARAFAAFALGLHAHELDDVAARQRIALGLVDALERPALKNDVHVAALLALGLCPAPVSPTLPPGELHGHTQVQAAVSRAGQIEWLLWRADPKKAKATKMSEIQRAHAYVALGRLAAQANEGSRRRVVKALTVAASSRTLDQTARSGACIGLGLTLRASSDDIDEDGMRALGQTLLRGQSLERRFAAIAMGVGSAQSGTGELIDAESALQVRRTLLVRLGTASNLDQPWVALALGLQGHALAEKNVDGAGDASRKLLERLRKERNNTTIGAYAISTALIHVQSESRAALLAKRALIDKFKRTKHPTARGHIAIALGILGASEARELLRDTLQSSRFQPELLWNTSVGLWLMEEPSLTPILIRTLIEAGTGTARAAAASALGRIGDERAIEPLLELVENEGHPAGARAFGIVGLGILCDEDRTPWRTPISHALPYFAVTETLVGNAKGLLEIL